MKMTKVNIESVKQALKGLNKERNIIHLEIECRDLPKQGSDIDPFVVIFEKKDQNLGGTEVKIGQTQTIEDERNPKFVKRFEVAYKFGENRWLELRCYHARD